MPKPLRRALKKALLRGYLAACAPARRMCDRAFGTTRLMVLVYHRVNDEQRDGVTVGIHQFDDQMRWLKRNFQVVNLEEIVISGFTGQEGSALAAVTFDDGYLDNYLHAAPILDRLGIRASFYVSTSMVGSAAAFPHDLRRLGVSLPTMSWPMLRDLSARGHAIGSHTANHINCGQASLDEIRSELIQSKQVIDQNLGPKPRIFAYPFGKPQDLRPDAVSVVREVGYVGCASAFGGSNSLPLDPFDIRRVGVDVKFDHLSFEAHLEGYRHGWWKPAVVQGYT